VKQLGGCLSSAKPSNAMAWPRAAFV
jgi:hypothetical protein